MKPLFRSDLDSILAATGPYWQQMRGQRLFLTGGTGFFGKWLVESFLHANRELALGAGITVLSRDPAAFAKAAPWLIGDPALKLVPGDIRTFSSPPGEFPFLIHAATEASAALVEADPAEMLSTQVAGTARLFQFAAEARTRKLLLTSSGAVYGRQLATLPHVGEDYAGAPDPTQSASVYGEGKRVAELMGALAVRAGEASGQAMEVKIARCFAFVGPHLPLDSHFAAGNFLLAALRNEPIRIAGDGTPLRSYLYAADLATWLWIMLFSAPSMRAFNVGAESAVSIRQLAEQVAILASPALPIEIARTPKHGEPPAQYVPSTARARAELGVRESVSLPEALERTLRWHRQSWRGKTIHLEAPVE